MSNRTPPNATASLAAVSSLPVNPNGFSYMSAKVECMLQSWNPDRVNPSMAKPAGKKQTEKAANVRRNGIMRMMRSGNME